MNTLTSVCMQHVNNLINLFKPSRQVGGATYMPPEYYGTTTTALFSDVPVTFTPPYQMGGCGNTSDVMNGGCGNTSDVMNGGCGSPSLPAMPVPESKV